MFKAPSLSALLILLFTLSPLSSVHSQSVDISAQTVIHLMSYVGLDYGGAVENGEIIDEMEYEEQVEFSEKAYELIESGDFLKGNKQLVLNDITLLRQKVEQKADAAEITALTDKIKNEIIQSTGVVTAPVVWPDLDNGQMLYNQSCAECHGDKGGGDGILAANLDPLPTDFLDKEAMERISPYQAFNTISLGLEGTTMRAFSEYDEQQRWDLAFYIKSLRFDSEKDSLGFREAFEQIYPEIRLAEVATLSDEELLALMEAEGGNENSLIAVRTLIPTADNLKSSLSFAHNELDDALEAYLAGDKKMARNAALMAYLEGIEPVETRLRTINSTFVVKLEKQMLAVRQSIEKDRGAETVEQEVIKAQAMIAEADNLLRGQTLNYWLTFILSLSIFLREGLEAFLILAVVFALIRTAKARKALPWFHGGWITAIVLGIAGWFLSDIIMQFGGKNREIMEGIVALSAVVILLWAGFWLHDKSHAKQWNIFVKDKIGKYLQRDRMWGLAVFSFMIVFREAFETVLFLRAISLEAAAENQSAIGLGVAAAVFIIVFIVFVFLKYSKLLPIRHLFIVSSWIVVVLALILTGKGIHSLQESGWVSADSLPSVFNVQWLGIYPTLQTLGAQIIILLLILAAYFWRERKLKRTESEFSNGH